MAPPFGEAAMRASCASSEDSVTPGRRSPKSGTTKPTEASMAIRPCLSSASRSRRTSQMFATPRGSKGLPGAAAPAIVLSVSGAAARIARRRRGRRASLVDGDEESKIQGSGKRRGGDPDRCQETTMLTCLVWSPLSAHRIRFSPPRATRST
jgi:hypothetical protein